MDRYMIVWTTTDDDQEWAGPFNLSAAETIVSGLRNSPSVERAAKVEWPW